MSVQGVDGWESKIDCQLIGFEIDTQVQTLEALLQAVWYTLPTFSRVLKLQNQGAFLWSPSI